MTDDWSSSELELIDAAEELQIAPTRRAGTPPRPVRIWVVSAGGDVFVRTWYRRDHGWFAHAVESGRARISVPGLETDVAVEDVSKAGRELRDIVDAAYRTKYRRYGDSSVDPMVNDNAADTTLRLNHEATPTAPPPPSRGNHQAW